MTCDDCVYPPGGVRCLYCTVGEGGLVRRFLLKLERFWLRLSPLGRCVLRFEKYVKELNR